VGKRHPELAGRRNRLALALIVAAAVLAVVVQPGTGDGHEDDDGKKTPQVVRKKDAVTRLV
jgi:hypothetical protein